jgi:hypothetical protein
MCTFEVGTSCHIEHTYLIGRQWPACIVHSVCLLSSRDTRKIERTPALIFDEQDKHVHTTKHARFLGLQSMTCTTSRSKRLPKLFASCDQCSTLLSGSKLNRRFRSFFLVNITHSLVEQCFNETNNNNVFGYLSQQHPIKIRHTMINNAKLAYSYDLDVQHTSFYFVLRLHSWPEDIRQIFHRRQRQWPVDVDKLFDGTCFIRLDHVEQDEQITNTKCSTCEKRLSLSSTSSWSYTYAAIENQLILAMSDEQIRFSSIMWNYLNGKTDGQLPFAVFKHVLFYFFEYYASDVYLTRDLISYAHMFVDFLVDRLHQKSMPHYFHSQFDFYNENLSTCLIQSLASKMTYTDLKQFSVHVSPGSSVYLYYLIYLIQFQSHFLQSLLSCTSSKTDSIQTILDAHELVSKQLSFGIRTYKRQLDMLTTRRTFSTLTLDRLYAYQEENVQIIVEYLPLLRDRQPSLLIHTLWSMFIQYFNCLFDDLFVSDENHSK